MNLVTFLAQKIRESIDSLVQGLNSQMEVGVLCSDKVVIMATSAFATLRELDMKKEVQLLELLIKTRAGEAGVLVPEEIQKLFMVSESLQAVPQVSKPVTAPSLQMVKAVQTIQSVQQPATSTSAPARTIISTPPLSEWKHMLSVVTSGQNTNLKKVQELTTTVFGSAVDLSESDWNLFFSALKKVEEKGQYILSSKLPLTKIFGSAPLGMLQSYLFGETDVVLSLARTVRDNKDAQLPGYMCAKVYTVLAAIKATDLREQVSSREVGVVNQLISALEAKKAPEKMLELANAVLDGDIVNSSELEKVHKKAQVPNNAIAFAFAKPAKKHSKANGHSPIPAEKFAGPSATIN